MTAIPYDFVSNYVQKNSILITKQIIPDNNKEYNFCLQLADISNHKGRAVNKRTNIYITNISPICLTVIYLGTHYSSDEGNRHYFLIKLDKPYVSLIGTYIHYLPVYISTGVNTGEICKQTKCIIPFFGVVTTEQRDQRDRNKNITYISSLLLKSDYLNAFRKAKEFNNIKQFYISDDSSHDLFENQLQRYFITNYNKKDLKEYRTKVGSVFMMDIINKNKKDILDYVENIEKQYYETKIIDHLHHLNYIIGENNFTGFRLQDFGKTQDTNKEMITRIHNTQSKKIHSMLNAPFFNRIIEYFQTKKL